MGQANAYVACGVYEKVTFGVEFYSAKVALLPNSPRTSSFKLPKGLGKFVAPELLQIKQLSSTGELLGVVANRRLGWLAVVAGAQVHVRGDL